MRNGVLGSSFAATPGREAEPCALIRLAFFRRTAGKVRISFGLHARLLFHLSRLALARYVNDRRIEGPSGVFGNNASHRMGATRSGHGKISGYGWQAGETTIVSEESPRMLHPDFRAKPDRYSERLPGGGTQMAYELARSKCARTSLSMAANSA